MAFGTRGRRRQAHARNRSFNPCFSGMAFGTQLRDRIADFHAPVSILVFLEWPLGLEGQSPRGPLQPVSILVFLEWPLGPTSIPTRPPPTSCFNPCFSGMAFGTPSHANRGDRQKWFQSLFFWNGLWDDFHGDQPYFFWRVSILVFLEWPLGPLQRPERRKAMSRFQSLFFWNGLWDAIKTSRLRRNPSVSILVFLEWPLGQGDGEKGKDEA